MTRSTLATACITVAALIAVVVLESLGHPVSPTLYALAGAGFGGHLALAQPTGTDKSANSLSVALTAVSDLVALLKPKSATVSPTTPSPPPPPAS